MKGARVSRPLASAAAVATAVPPTLIVIGSFGAKPEALSPTTLPGAAVYRLRPILAVATVPAVATWIVVEAKILLLTPKAIALWVPALRVDGTSRPLLKLPEPSVVAAPATAPPARNRSTCSFGPKPLPPIVSAVPRVTGCGATVSGGGGGEPIT